VYGFYDARGVPFETSFGLTAAISTVAAAATAATVDRRNRASNPSSPILAARQHARPTQPSRAAYFDLIKNNHRETRYRLM